MHGLLLRNTQVKLTDGESLPARARPSVSLFKFSYVAFKRF